MYIYLLDLNSNSFLFLSMAEVASKAVSSAFTSAEVVAVIALGLAVVMSVKSRN